MLTRHLTTTTFKLVRQNCLLRVGGLNGNINWHRSTHIAFQHSLLRPTKSIFLNFRVKSTASSELWSWRAVWNKLFGKYLLATNTISSGVLMVVGDIMAQELLFMYHPPTNEGRYDYRRLCRMFIVGALQGPLHYYVYNWMDKVMPVPNLRNIGRKILIDQLVMSPICIFMFFYSACFLERKSLSETNEELRAKFPYIYFIDWTIWPAAQYVNFKYLETKYRVMYVNLVTALYNVFISYMKHEFQVEKL